MRAFGIPRVFAAQHPAGSHSTLWQSGVDYKLISKWQGHQDGGKLILDTYTEVFGDDDASYEKQQLAKIK